MAVVDISDRGPAKYFHGRSLIRNRLLTMLGGYKSQGGGTVFLIQDAPGAGKTAFAYQFMKDAAKAGWQACVIRTDALWNPAVLGECLQQDQPINLTRTKGLRAMFSVLGFGIGKRGGTTTQYRGPSTLQILRNTARNAPLLLVLDEAQDMSDHASSPERSTIRQTLERIHNGNVGAPVVLLAVGLGTTEEVFEQFGIPRLRKGFPMHLGPLKAEAEASVIRDWLTKEAEAQESVDAWIYAIAKETLGWPQHIMAFMETAVNEISTQGGSLQAADLDKVLAQGIWEKSNYYRARTRGLDAFDCTALGSLLAHHTDDMSINPELIVRALTFNPKRDEGEARRLLDTTVRRGVFANHDDRFGFTLPTPSMRSWLVGLYEWALAGDDKTLRTAITQAQHLLPPSKHHDDSE